jgi:bile acid:Na+ symporter, BASS family
MTIDVALQILDISIALLFVSVGLRVRLADALLLLRNRELGLRSLLALYVFVPCCTFLVIWSFPLEPALRVSLLAMSVAPLCPVLVKAAIDPETEGDYLFALQIFAAVAAIVALPVMVAATEYMFDFPTQYPVGKVAWFILRQIGIPLAVGIVLSRLMGIWREKSALWLDRVGNTLLTAGVLMILYLVLPEVWGMMVNGRVLYIAAFTGIAITGGYLFGGPQKGIKDNLIMASVQRHPGITYVIATTILPGEEGPIFAAVVIFAIVGTIATIPYVVKSSKQEASG